MHCLFIVLHCCKVENPQMIQMDHILLAPVSLLPKHLKYTLYNICITFSYYNVKSVFIIQEARGVGPDMGFMTLEKRGRSVGTPASVTGDGDQQAVSAPAPAGVHLYSVQCVHGTAGMSPVTSLLMAHGERWDND